MQENCTTKSASEQGVICKDCATVNVEELVAQVVEKRYEEQQLPFFEEPFPTNTTRMDRDVGVCNTKIFKEREFYFQGLHLIDATINKLNLGEMSKPVNQKAAQLYEKVFRIQYLQKRGILPMKRTKGTKPQQRKKFSKKQQYAISCLFQAMQDNNLPITLEGTKHILTWLKSCWYDNCRLTHNSNSEPKLHEIWKVVSYK